MKKSIPKKINNAGFTLLETLVAIFILTLSITGPVYIASVAFHNTIDSRDNISAQYIAEEVVEVIRNKRDKYTLINADGSDWLSNVTGTTDCRNTEGAILNKCVMIRNTNTEGDYDFAGCVNGLCPSISFNPKAGAVYGEVGGTTFSKFTREFYFETPATSQKEAILTVNIKWEDKGRPKIYTLKERLYPVNYKAYFKPGTN